MEPKQILATIERALAGVTLMRGQVAVGTATATETGDAIVGQSPAMQEVYKAIGRVANTDAAVSIRGESGTGKELVDIRASRWEGSIENSSHQLDASRLQEKKTRKSKGVSGYLESSLTIDRFCSEKSGIRE